MCCYPGDKGRMKWHQIVALQGHAARVKNALLEHVIRPGDIA